VQAGLILERERRQPIGLAAFIWLRGQDSNLRPSGYEPEGRGTRAPYPTTGAPLSVTRPRPARLLGGGLARFGFAPSVVSVDHAMLSGRTASRSRMKAKSASSIAGSSGGGS
jgi:hypothetical protein